MKAKLAALQSGDNRLLIEPPKASDAAQRFEAIKKDIWSIQDETKRARERLHFFFFFAHDLLFFFLVVAVARSLSKGTSFECNFLGWLVTVAGD
jgi:hypothetical protein